MWRVWSLVSVSIATYFTLPVLFCNPDIRKITQELLLVKRQPATAARCPAEETQTLATNPLNRDTDWSSIHAFCDQLNNDLEGPQLATRLLAHKIQSPQEWEAMQALLVLETCMKNCGKRFHSEVGKFRFLNELIKVYLGSRSPEPVKKKVLELIYSWTLGLPDEAKISDAYQMLKKQGIIKQDPELPPDKLLNLPPPRPKNAIFEDEEKSKMLSRLLNSSHPEDLKAATNSSKKWSKRIVIRCICPFFFSKLCLSLCVTVRIFSPKSV
uniref:VHS domain-containing protein n=1 Tax=Sphaeramia orbicularis TaxID=375764 RepID=A0A672ZVJ9_9TELE